VVTGDLSTTAGYSQILLYSESVATVYIDDIIVSNTYNGTIGGQVTSPEVGLTPNSVVFGSENVGVTTSAQTVTLKNTGNGTLTITSIGLAGTNPGDFAQTNTCPTGSTTLAAGASCTITVTFTPTATGSRNASLSIVDNATGSPQSVLLAGTGVSAGTYFSENFETGNFGQWSGPFGTGGATVETTVVNTGTHAAALTNTSGQYTYLTAPLVGGAQSNTYTRFYFQITSGATSSPIMKGRNASGSALWEVDYDAGTHGLDIYFWNGGGTRFALYSVANAISANTWYTIEVQDSEATSGTGQVWLNGTSIGVVTGDLSTTAGYSQILLYSESVATVYIDDIIVKNAFI
jgi:hypothetical protein